jgi:uncharacterized glyoxalase superfamily protein PhnB
MPSDSGHPAVAPMLSYEECGGAADWLVHAFGFQQVERLRAESGRVSHVTLAVPEGTGFVMLGTPSAAYEDPARHREGCAPARAWADNRNVIDGVLVYVADPDAHCEAARARGARIVREPTTSPVGRQYVAEDPAGHRWMFLAWPSGAAG